jgi:hypothetical protein
MTAELVPSLLLHLDQVPPDVQTLLKRSRTGRKKGEWALAEWCAMDARDACKHRNDHLGVALAQLHLADVYREVGELGEAMGLCEEAYQILHGHAAKVQRHNEAVAAYAQGLLHERFLFGDDMQAVRWYRQALELLETAKEHWAAEDDRKLFKACERAYRRIAQLKKRILRARSGGERRLDAFDVLQPDSRESALPGVIIDANHAEIDGVKYLLHSGALPSNDGDRRRCFALPVSDLPACTFPAAEDGDYVVMRSRWFSDASDPEGVWIPGVVWGSDSEWEIGDFTFEPSGRTWFYPCASKAHVIGGRPLSVKGGPPKDPQKDIRGHIIGLLKPEE